MLQNFSNDATPSHVHDFYLSRLFNLQSSSTNITDSYLSGPPRARGGDGRFVSKSDMISPEIYQRKTCGWCHTSSTSQWRVGTTSGSAGKFPFIITH